MYGHTVGTVHYAFFPCIMPWHHAKPLSVIGSTVASCKILTRAKGHHAYFFGLDKPRATQCPFVASCIILSKY